MKGNMWAQDWENIYDLVAPFPNLKDIQVTESLVKKNLTSKDLFKVIFVYFFSVTDLFYE
jgi:peptidyl-dipeptidase A